MTRRTYDGSCHCGDVRFTAEIDLADGIRKCNCTWCVKTGTRKIFCYGDGLAIKSQSSGLADYRGPESRWPEGQIHHHFCPRCGVYVFSRGFLEFAPFNGWFHAVNLNVLDNVTPEEIIAAPVIYEDGLHDNQMQPPEETRHL